MLHRHSKDHNAHNDYAHTSIINIYRRVTHLLPQIPRLRPHPHRDSRNNDSRVSRLCPPQIRIRRSNKCATGTGPIAHIYSLNDLITSFINVYVSIQLYLAGIHEGGGLPTRGQPQQTKQKKHTIRVELLRTNTNPFETANRISTRGGWCIFRGA